MSIYDEMQPVADELLGSKDFKQGIIEYVKVTPGAGPIDNPGSSTFTKTVLKAATGGIVKYIMSGLAIAGDKLVTSAVVAALTPSIKDFIDIDGERFKIVEYIPKPAAGTAVAWKFIVRKG